MIRDFIFGIAIILSLVAAYLFALPIYVANPEMRGLFGDSFGALNALLSGLAFVAIFISLRYQKRDLDETLKEIKRSSDAQEKNAAHQNDMLKLQAISAIINHKHKSYAVLSDNIDEMRKKRLQQIGKQTKEILQDSIDRAELDLHEISKSIMTHEKELNQLYSKIRCDSGLAAIPSDTPNTSTDIAPGIKN